MRPADRDLAARISNQLESYEQDAGQLSGLIAVGRRYALLDQLVESVRRREYITRIRGSELSQLRRDPRTVLFDPIKGAILAARNGETEEAFWLAFLSVQFGKHRKGGWRYCAAVYADGERGPWTWHRVSNDLVAFKQWFASNAGRIKAAGGGFGNHRKYESLAASADTISSYVSWVGSSRSQVVRFDEITGQANGDQKRAFDLLYESLQVVARFGRTARFDYLTMLSRLELVPIVAPRAYLQGATGPLAGARMLYGDPSIPAGDLEMRLARLDKFLRLGFDIIEDGLCNWQKSPATFVPFRG